MKRIARFAWISIIKPLLMIATCPIWIPFALLAMVVLFFAAYFREAWKRSGKQ